MKIQTALNLAIGALESQVQNTFEGDELKVPAIQKWIKFREEALEVLKDAEDAGLCDGL